MEVKFRRSEISWKQNFAVTWQKSKRKFHGKKFETTSSNKPLICIRWLSRFRLVSICYDRCDHWDYCRESWAILTTASFQMIAMMATMATRTKPNSDTYYLFLSKHLWQFNVNQMHKILILIPFQDYQFYTCKILLTLCLGFNYYDTILSVQRFVFYSLALRGVLVDREFQRQNLWKGLEREWHRKLEDM